MLCTKCGEKNDESVKFCTNCGTSIGGSASRTVSSRKRPISLIVIVIWTILCGISAILSWTFIVVGQQGASTLPGWVGTAAAFNMIIGFMGLVGCYGLWNLQKWGLYLVGLYYCLAFLITIISLFSVDYGASMNALMPIAGLLSDSVPLIFIYRLKVKLFP